MSLVILDIPGVFFQGFLPAVVMIAGILFAIQAVITFLLWRKGDQSFYLKFVSFLTATICLLCAFVSYLIALSESEALLNVAAVVMLIGVPIAAGIQIYLYIRDTWFSDAAIEKRSAKGKLKEPKGLKEEKI
ncbi:MAG TPA: hypothetical protein VMV49_03995 [Candidatus Deferrimicrobium sp.]|nr:hypothetical protein [Candidatus Deferrimicrobium sp.]